MAPGDERYERLKHQSFFLRLRGLTPPEMDAWHRHPSLLERLAGKCRCPPQLTQKATFQILAEAASA
jgi:hypothetical protein